MSERLEFELTLDGVAQAQAQLDKFKSTISSTETVVDKIDKSIKNTEKDIKALNAAIAAGGPNIDQYRSALQRLEGAKRNVGQAALEVSRGLEDLQYGVGGIVNNIPSLVMSLGGTAGLTAVISLTAVGINQLVKHFPELTGEIKKTKEEIEKADKAFQDFRSTVGAKFNEKLDAAMSQLKTIQKEISTYDPVTGKKLEAHAQRVVEATEREAEAIAERERIKKDHLKNEKDLAAIEEQLAEYNDSRKRGLDGKRKAYLLKQKEILGELVTKYGKTIITDANETIGELNKVTEEIKTKSDTLGELEDRNKKGKKEKKGSVTDFHEIHDAKADWNKYLADQDEFYMKLEDRRNAQLERFKETKNGERALNEVATKEEIENIEFASEVYFDNLTRRIEQKKRFYDEADKAAKEFSKRQEKQYIDLQKFEMKGIKNEDFVLDKISGITKWEQISSAKMAYDDLVTDHVISNLGKMSDAEHAHFMESLKEREDYYDRWEKMTEKVTGALTSISQDYIEAKIKGEEEAELRVVSSLMRVAGEALVSSGIQAMGSAGAHFAKGIAGVPEGLAAAAIGGGLIAAGVGLGAGAVAIDFGIDQRADAAREQEREKKKAERDSGIKNKADKIGGGGGITLNLSYGVAGPLPEDTARLISRELKAGQRRGVA